MARPHDLLRAVARGKSVAGSAVDAAVVESAMEHRMASLLLASVVAPDEISTGAAATLIAFDMAVIARRRQQDEIMELVHERLDAAGVTHTFLKGATSAIRWFEKPTHRPYSDIDVVVPPGEPLRVAVRSLDELHPVLPVLESPTARLISSVDMTVGGVRIDVQADALRTGLAPKGGESWIIGTRELEFSSGKRFRVLDPEHDLVMFLLHQGRDRFRYLLGVAEAGRRLERPLDWKRVEAISRAEGIWDQVAVALEIMCNELRMEVPVKAPAGWRTALWRKLWRPEVRLLGELGRIRHMGRAKWIMPLTMRGRSIDTLNWLARSLFPPDPVLRHKYPQASGPYLWRVVSSRVRVVGRRRVWVWKRSRQ